MALQTFGTSIGTGVRVPLGTTDSAFIAAGGLISSSDGNAIVGTGSNHFVHVQGTVVAHVNAITLGDFGVTTNEYVLIDTTGFVGSYNPTFGGLFAIAIYTGGTGGSTVENRGMIYGGGTSGGIDFGNMAEQATLINSGTIEAQSDPGEPAIRHVGAGALVVHNSGTIKSVVALLDPFSAFDSIVNTGTMIGQVRLGGGDDSYSGGSGRLSGTLFGGEGNDTAIGGIDNDRFEGENGNDKLTGNGGADTLIGGTGNDTLTGGAGNDVLTGGANNDILTGGAGKDTLTGGANKDIFFFNAPLSVSTNLDRIADFSHVDDTIQLAKSIFKGMGSGALLSKYFYAGTKAHDADDRIIYNKATGALYYDSDGTGAHAQVQFATISNHATAGLAYNDFVLI